MNTQKYCERDWCGPARKFKALGHPVRLWIAQRLLERERPVAELVESTDFEFSTISQHLCVMKNAGVVAAAKRGKQIFYSLKCECVRRFLECVAEHRAGKKKCAEEE